MFINTTNKHAIQCTWEGVWCRTDQC